MTLSRRKFLTISAAAIGLPRSAVAESWQGRAFGADISLEIRGPRDVASFAVNEARRVIRETEALFSLYDPASALVRLNREGRLRAPTPPFHALMQAADGVFRQTEGLFDPTVQSLWRAMAEGRPIATAVRGIGWRHVSFDRDEIALRPDQELTFNGIAQGFATDRVTEIFTSLGLGETLVNIGEHRGTGGPWTLAIQDPVHGVLGQRRLTDGAIATSSPAATPLGDHGHILHPIARPQWSSVTVEAPTATIADGFSTAMVLATRDQIEEIRTTARISRVTLIDFDGNLSTL